MPANKAPILVTLAVFTNVHEAHMAKNYLETCGISCFLENENMNSLYANALGGVKLKVPSNELDLALNFFHEGDFALQPNSKNKKFPTASLFVCPVCGHINQELYVVKPSNIVEKLAIWFGFKKQKIRCIMCDSSFYKSQLRK